ncbi:MAG: hypothetical protein K2J40_10320 [Ruminococcus sp.]|nr:hypothetical protein [Ruminococcus sp.]
MFKKYKFILPVLFTAFFSLSGCGDDIPSETQQSTESLTEITTVQEDDIIAYDTVDPPENGWTTEEIMNVTYLCDKKLEYPLSLEFLGDDFSLSHYVKSASENRLVPARLEYKNKYLANATVVKPHDETMIYNIVLLPDTCKVEDVEPFVINGVKMYDSFDDVIKALGNGYQYITDDSVLYNDRETNESLYSLFFEDGKLVHINVGFRFDIDLPLYENLQKRFS